MIEMIKGYSHKFEELEQLVNDFVVQCDGKVKHVIQSDKQVNSNQGHLVNTQELIFVIEYDTPLQTWQELYNQISFDGIEHEDVLKTIFKLDQTFASDETLNELIEVYKDESLVADLCRLNNFEFKEVDDNE